MNNTRKLLALLLAFVMGLSLATAAFAEEELSIYDLAAVTEMDYDDLSDEVYDLALGEFYENYSVAKEEIEDLDLRMALMAIADAKLMESGVFLPIQSNGGNYAISAQIPRTVTTTPWGLDEYKNYTMLVADKLLTAEDRTALTGMWAEAESADDYIAAAKTYLEENGYAVKDTYNTLSPYELQTWDVIASSYTSDSFFITPTFSGLMEYDIKNQEQPALATSYEVSDDGLVYTFHIREGVNWVDQQGRVIAPVTADDWVASMQHVADNNDALGYLMSSTDGCGIKNYDAYCYGEIADFAEVGVKAIDDYTLEYTLEAPFPPFITMMGYGCFAPLNRAFYESQGGKFGAEYDPSAADYNYGKTPANIAYCGPYLVTNYTEKTVTSYAPNPEYWDPDHVNTPYVNFYYYDGTDVLRPYNDIVSGTIDGYGLNSSAVVQAQQDVPEGETETYFDIYSYVSLTDATTFCGWVNINRATWTNYNDETQGVSPKTEDDIARTRVAMLNQNFRLALLMAFDRGAYMAQSVGEDLKYASMRNAYTPGTFSVLANDVTVDINGESVTFPAGTYFGEMEQAQLDADGYPIKVWNPEMDGGVGSGDGYDGWYNSENAKAQLELAVAALAEQGVEVSAENPIYIDYPYGTYSQVTTNQANAFKQSVESSLDGAIIINLIAFEDRTVENDATYRFSTGNEANFDLSTGSGWGPDYGDAQSYLDTIQPYGYMAKNLGLY